MFVHRLLDDVGLLDGEGADDDAVGAGVDPAVDGVVVADAAGDLDGDFAAEEGDDAADDGVVDGAAFLGGVEVDDVDAVGALAVPVLGHGDGVDAVDGLTLEVALLELDALAVADVDGRVADPCMKPVSWSACQPVSSQVGSGRAMTG